MRFPLRFATAYRVLSRSILVSPDDSYVDVTDVAVHVRMAWAFRAIFPRDAVATTKPFEGKTIARGVHGWGGRWLVNGSGDRIVVIGLVPAQRARVVGIPVTLRELMVSVDDPTALAAALA
jgi:hypothetical protein